MASAARSRRISEVGGEMGQKVENEIGLRAAKHLAFKPVAIPAVIAAVQMQKAAAVPTRTYELPAILRKEAQLG